MDFRFSNGQILRYAFTNTLGILAWVGCMSWYLGPGRLDISGIRADIDKIWQTTTLPWVADIPICPRSSCGPLSQAVYSSSLFVWVSCYMDLPPIDGHSKMLVWNMLVTWTYYQLCNSFWAEKNTHRFFTPKKKVVMVKPYLATATWFRATQLWGTVPRQKLIPSTWLTKVHSCPHPVPRHS